jgi:hypothetical protein
VAAEPDGPPPHEIRAGDLPLSQRYGAGRLDSAPATGALAPWQIVALVGAAVMIISVFCPVVSIGKLGTQNLIRGGAWPGVAILVAAGLAGLFAVTRDPVFMALAAAGALAVGGIQFVRMLEVINTSSTPSSPFGGQFLALLSLDASLSWGWAVLLIGASTVIGAFFVGRER